jgi:hypothetical protein
MWKYIYTRTAFEKYADYDLAERMKQGMYPQSCATLITAALLSLFPSRKIFQFFFSFLQGFGVHIRIDGVRMIRMRTYANPRVLGERGQSMKTKGKIVAWALVAALAAFAIPSMALAGTDVAGNSASGGNASTAIATSATDTSASATNGVAYTWNQTCGNANCPGYADVDGDGVCDNCGSVNATGDAGCQGYVDEDGDGVCDNRGNGLGRGTCAGNAFHHGNGVGCGACCAK